MVALPGATAPPSPTAPARVAGTGRAVHAPTPAARSRSAGRPYTRQRARLAAFPAHSSPVRPDTAQYSAAQPARAQRGRPRAIISASNPPDGQLGGQIRPNLSTLRSQTGPRTCRPAQIEPSLAQVGLRHLRPTIRIAGRTHPVSPVDTAERKRSQPCPPAPRSPPMLKTRTPFACLRAVSDGRPVYLTFARWCEIAGRSGAAARSHDASAPPAAARNSLPPPWNPVKFQF